MAEEWARIGLDLHLYIDRDRGRRGGLEQALREAIRQGRLSPDTRLPSSRALALELGFARGTVTQVYEQLAAEGYLTARPRSGVRVAPRHDPAPGPALPPVAAFRQPVHGFDLRPGLPDLSMFPRREWLAATRHVLRTAPNAALGYGDPTGDVELRTALAGYLGRARGVRTTPDHIIVCAGYTHALRIVCQALGSAAIAFENPTLLDYPALAESVGLRVTRIPVDDEGMVVGDLTDEAAAVLTPAHQLPLGVTLGPQRRLDLLAWARRTGAVIVEDDYDGEFRYDRQPVGALQGLAPDHVVYAGTVSKTVAPALRIAWLAAPTHLVPALRDALRFDETHVNVLDQLAFARLIDRGELDRHLRRCRTRYRRRRDRLGRAVADGPAGARLSGIAAGLHALIRLPDEVALPWPDPVAVDDLSSYYHRAADAPRGVVVGYATPPQHAFEGAMDALVAALHGRMP